MNTGENEAKRVFAALIDDLLSCGRISPIKKTRCKQPLKKSEIRKNKADTQKLYGLRSDRRVYANGQDILGGILYEYWRK